MSYTVLARKYRPQTFADLVGQEHVSRTLANALQSGRVAHAFLFTGARGVGKTTTARLLAKALNCEQGPTATPCNQCDACREITLGNDIDVLEIDGASNNGVDDVRRLQETLPFRPARDRFKIVIVDEVHMLSTGAFNAFLKTLEEPPAHVKFVFATTEIHKVPITIRSRCQRYDFRLIPHAVVAERVREILRAEQIVADEAAIALVAREAAGSMRDALTVLDQVLALGDTELHGDSVARGLAIASRESVMRAVEAALSGDAAACLQCVSEIAEQGLDVLHFTRQLLECARDLVVLRVVGGSDGSVALTPDELARARQLAEAHERAELERLFAGLTKLIEDVGQAAMPQMTLEMGLVRLASRPPLVSVQELITRLKSFEDLLSGGPGPSGPTSAPFGGGAAGDGSRGSRGAPPRRSASAPSGEPRAEASAAVSDSAPPHTAQGSDESAGHGPAQLRDATSSSRPTAPQPSAFGAPQLRDAAVSAPQPSAAARSVGATVGPQLRDSGSTAPQPSAAASHVATQGAQLSGAGSSRPSASTPAANAAVSATQPSAAARSLAASSAPQLRDAASSAPQPSAAARSLAASPAPQLRDAASSAPQPSAAARSLAASPAPQLRDAVSSAPQPSAAARSLAASPAPQLRDASSTARASAPSPQPADGVRAPARLGLVGLPAVTPPSAASAPVSSASSASLLGAANPQAPSEARSPGRDAPGVSTHNLSAGAAAALRLSQALARGEEPVTSTTARAVAPTLSTPQPLAARSPDPANASQTGSSADDASSSPPTAAPQAHASPTGSSAAAVADRASSSEPTAAPQAHATPQPTAAVNASAASAPASQQAGGSRDRQPGGSSGKPANGAAARGPSALAGSQAQQPSAAKAGGGAVAASDSSMDSDWARIVTLLRSAQPALAAVLNHGMPLEVTAATLRIGFPDGSFFGRQAQATSAREALLRAAEQVLGARPNLLIGSPGDSKISTLAEIEEDGRRQRSAAKREAALSHPAVLDAMEIFGESEASVDVQVDIE